MGRGLLRDTFARFEAAARARGYRITWAPQVIIDRPDAELGFELEFVLAHLMLKKKDIFFIQIGANDGVTSDPLYKFVSEFGWSGIMVEPMPQAFAQLKANHADNPRLKLINAALSNTDGTQTLYSVRMDQRTFSHADMYSSFDRNVVLRNSRFVPDIAQRIIEVKVPAISMASLMRETGGREVDVLTIDTEGFDYQILKMIDFTRIKPPLICYEHTHLSRADMQAAANMLAAQGYRMSRDNLDTIAYHPGFTYGWKALGEGAQILK